MTYQVKLTDHAMGQIKETVGYISRVLLEPEVARRWSDRLKKGDGLLGYHAPPLSSRE